MSFTFSEVATSFYRFSVCLRRILLFDRWLLLYNYPIKIGLRLCFKEQKKDQLKTVVWEAGRCEDTGSWWCVRVRVQTVQYVNKCMLSFPEMTLGVLSECRDLQDLHSSSFWQLCMNTLSAGTPPAEPIPTHTVCELLNILEGETGEKEEETL